jgi:hypothetical protein
MEDIRPKMDVEARAIVRRIFVRAAEQVGSAAHLSERLSITYAELRTYLFGEAVPPEAVLLEAVQLIIEQLPYLRGEFSKEAWQSLRLPRDAARP